MIVRSKKHQVRLIGSYLLLVAVAALEINVPGFFWEPFTIWIRIAVPLLLIAGLSGTFISNRFLRAIGWVGITTFTLFVFCLAFLSDDYIAQGTPESAPNVPHAGAFAWRILLYLLTCALLVVCYKRLLSKAKTETACNVES